MSRTLFACCRRRVRWNAIRSWPMQLLWTRLISCSLTILNLLRLSGCLPDSLLGLPSARTHGLLFECAMPQRLHEAALKLSATV
eukprot:7309874-Pyramimonas_sp.AAC.1